MVLFFKADLAIFAALSYPIYLFSAVTSISEFFKCLLILFLLIVIFFRQFLQKLFIPSESKFIEFITLKTIKGLKVFNSKSIDLVNEMISSMNESNPPERSKWMKSDEYEDLLNEAKAIGDTLNKYYDATIPKNEEKSYAEFIRESQVNHLSKNLIKILKFGYEA